MTPPPEPSVSYRQLAREAVVRLRPHGRLVAGVLGVQVLTAVAAGVADPLLMAGVIDSLTDADPRRFGFFVLLSLSVATGMRALSYLSALVTRRLTNGLTSDLVGEAFEAFAAMPHAVVERHEAGYHTSRIFDEPSRVASSLLVAMSLIRNGVLVIVALAVCLALAWEVALGLAVIVPVLVALSRKYGSRVARETVRGDEEEAALRAAVGRSVGGHLPAQLFRLEGVAGRHVFGALGALLGTRYRRTRESARLSTTSALFLSYAETAVLVGAGIQVLRGALSVGGLFGFTKAFWNVVNATRSLVDLIPQVAVARGQLSRHVEYCVSHAAPEPEPDAEPQPHTALEGAAFRHGEAAVFEDVDLTVPYGERVMLRGPNGVGKSTLARVVAGALAPDAGRRTGPSTARTSALLLPFGFPPGTLGEHLRLDERAPADAARARDLADRLGLAELLDRDPAQLSQGEQRRAQVLLALAKRADLYVFDEPLSNVDDAGREQLMDVILTETDGAGLLVVLHGDGHYDEAFDQVLSMEPTGTSASVRRPDADWVDDPEVAIEA